MVQVPLGIIASLTTGPMHMGSTSAAQQKTALLSTGRRVKVGPTLKVWGCGGEPPPGDLKSTPGHQANCSASTSRRTTKQGTQFDHIRVFACAGAPDVCHQRKHCWRALMPCMSSWTRPVLSNQHAWLVESVSVMAHLADTCQWPHAFVAALVSAEPRLEAS